jgi:hypothetical protein
VRGLVFEASNASPAAATIFPMPPVNVARTACRRIDLPKNSLKSELMLFEDEEWIMTCVWFGNRVTQGFEKKLDLGAWPVEGLWMFILDMKIRAVSKA